MHCMCGTILRSTARASITEETSMENDTDTLDMNLDLNDVLAHPAGNLFANEDSVPWHMLPVMLQS